MMLRRLVHLAEDLGIRSVVDVPFDGARSYPDRQCFMRHIGPDGWLQEPSLCELSGIQSWKMGLYDFLTLGCMCSGVLAHCSRCNGFGGAVGNFSLGVRDFVQGWPNLWPVDMLCLTVIEGAKWKGCVSLMMCCEAWAGSSLLSCEELPIPFIEVLWTCRCYLNLLLCNVCCACFGFAGSGSRGIVSLNLIFWFGAGDGCVALMLQQ
ncbi:hypothetical protein Nepgr_006678 [Nepenthes gracilis]|uniref:Uncharacterized protein n=1 Tax=Nepenthes gracilis TaxID=150966 RepID=A0AAD3S5L3_NEPGR|nr:hypothetical protein Nepgr_006678 [Nepenthes gracilis]